MRFGLAASRWRAALVLACLLQCPALQSAGAAGEPRGVMRAALFGTAAEEESANAADGEPTPETGRVR